MAGKDLVRSADIVEGLAWFIDKYSPKYMLAVNIGGGQVEEAQATQGVRYPAQGGVQASSLRKAGGSSSLSTRPARLEEEILP